MRKKRSKKKKMLSLFLKSVGITLVVGGALVAALIWSYKHFIYNGDTGSNNINLFPKKQEINKTLAVLGVDIDGYRTDVIFLVNFNSETNKAKIVSIPRDTRVEWTEEQTRKVKETNGYTVTVSKINEMSSYSGIDNLRDFALPQIEAMMDIKIDNYVVVTLEAFREIVDAIGGVEVNVPMRMYYEDPYQDLYIDLQEGIQTLDGKHAEMLVRFRKGYAEGDVGRVKTQQLFLEALAKKVTSPEMITKVPKLVPVLFNAIQTDMQLPEITGYYNYMKVFNTQNMSFDIIPGEGKMMNGKSYYVINETVMPEFIDRVVHDKVIEEEIPAVIDKAVTIEILNGSGVTGAAGTAKATLESEGYTVSNIGNYQQQQMETTYIYAKDITKAEQFKNHYAQSVVEEKQDIAYDIQIVLGKVQ